MNHSVGIAVALVVLLTVHVLGTFHCKRDEDQCKNGSSCNDKTGICICNNGTSGYDCSIIDANIDNGTVCDGFCENGGTCHIAGGDATPTCLCPVEYLGQNCSDLRYEVICETDNMTLLITPFVPTFTGSVFVVDQQGKTACTATDGGNGVQTITVDHADADCGSTTDDDAAGTKTRCFFVIYNNKTFTTRDQRICAVCGQGDTITKTAGNITITDLDTNIDDRTIGTPPVDSDVGIVLLKDDVEVSGTVSLGEDLDILVYLTSSGSERFEALQLQSCVATNNKPTTDDYYNSGMLVEDNCLSADMEIVLDDDLNRTMDMLNVSFSFSAFKFLHGDIVLIRCTVKPCIRIADCAPTACYAGENPNSGVGRRKRQAGSEPEENKVLSRTYKIGLPDAGDTRGQQDVTKEVINACYNTWEMTATVIALAVALFLVLLLCLFLIVRAILNRRTKTFYKDDSSYGSDDRLSHLPKIVPAKS